MPRYYPLLLNLENQPVLIVGGGPIAARKAATMIEYGAHTRVVARTLSPEIRLLSSHTTISLHEREFQDSDLDDATIVFAATNDPALHERIKTGCDKRRIPCNVVDVPTLCSFIVPSIIRRGELMITISTDGLCPAYAKYQRLRLESCCFPAGAEQMLHVVAAARQELKGPLGKGLTDEQKFEMLKALVEGDLAEVLQREGEDAAKAEAVRRIHEPRVS